MELYLDRRAVRQIRVAAQDAIEEGDIETSREDILEAFTEDQIEEIERRLDHGDMFEFLTDILDEWSGEDADELFELLETQLGEVGIQLKLDAKVDEDADADDDADEEAEEDEDLADDDAAPELDPETEEIGTTDDDFDEEE
jgi:hypothetical protein